MSSQIYLRSQLKARENKALPVLLLSLGLVAARRGGNYSMSTNNIHWENKPGLARLGGNETGRVTHLDAIVVG
jgi:hypothetical protein